MEKKSLLEEYLEGFLIQPLDYDDKQELLEIVEPHLSEAVYFEDYSISRYITERHLRGISDCYVHPDAEIRKIAVRLIQLNMQQVDLDCRQLIPCLFAMTTDPDEDIQQAGKAMLQDADDISPLIITTLSSTAVRFTFELHKVLSTDLNIVRGINIDPATQSVSAVNKYLYAQLVKFPFKMEPNVSAVHFLLRDLFKQMISLETDLPYKLYLCDNLAYFPYKTRGEVLCVLWYINMCLTQNSKEQLASLRKNMCITEHQEILFYTDFDAKTLDSIVKSLPRDCKEIFIDIHVIYILLLMLRTKEYLVEAYTVANSMNVHSPYVKEEDDDLYVLCYDECEFSPVEAISIIEDFPLVPAVMTVDEDVRRDLVKEYVFMSIELGPYVAQSRN